LLDDYYDECGWNKEDGTPTNAKLSELGLQSAGDS
jgi:aldehyde:ferredoxin oxidoreductase